MRMIDADDFIERVDKAAQIMDISSIPIPYIRQCVVEMPTIDIESLMKHGKWIETEYKPHVYCKCSLCGHREKINDKSNYRPNCGAKMDLEAREDET